MKLEKRGGYQNVKPTCFTCGKKHYCEFLLGTGSFYGCVKHAHKVIDCPNIACSLKDSKHVAPSVPKDDAPTNRSFYALWTTGEKPNDCDRDEGKSFLISISDMRSLSVGECGY